MQRPRGHGGGGGGPPHPAKPGPPPTGAPPRGPRQPWPPGPCQPGPPQPVNCACWATLGAACGAGAALATLASPMADRPSAPAIAPVPITLFRVIAIPSSVCFDRKFDTFGTTQTLISTAMNPLYLGSATRMSRPGQTLSSSAAAPLRAQRLILL